MEFIILAAIGGGLGVGALMLLQGIGAALACAALGGSLCAAVAAFILMARRGENWAIDETDAHKLDEQTDRIVKELREMAKQGTGDKNADMLVRKQSRAA